MKSLRTFELNDANNTTCNASQSHSFKDKAGIGGSLHLHGFASLLPTPGRMSFITSNSKSNDT